MKKKPTEQREKSTDKRDFVMCVQAAEVILVAFLLNLSFVIACKLLYNAYFPIGKVNQVILCAVVTCVGILMLSMGKYFAVREKTFAETLSGLVAVIVALDFVFISLLYFSMSVRLSLYVFILTNVLQIVMLLLLKALFRQGKQGLLEENRVLIISKDETSHQELRDALAQNARRVACICFGEDGEELFGEQHGAGSRSQLERAIRMSDVIYLSDDMTKAQKDKLISYCIFNHKNVYLIPETYEIALRRSELTQIGDVPVFNISSFRLTRAQLFAKRTLDIIASVVGLLLSCPIWIPAMILIKREDGGSIFFKQTRAGRGGREFDVIKLRTMIPDAEKYTGAVFAQENDPRITRVGKKLRAMRIDEIPQFLNVLKGEMSLVGPRPERPVFVKEFAENLPEYNGRLMVKPGITGLAQVLGNYTTSAANKAKFDLVYIRNYSIWLDLKILLKTVAVVFRKEQAEGVRIKDANARGERIGTTGDVAATVALAGEEDVFALAARPARKRRWVYQGIKATVLTMCVLLALSGIVVLRYSNLFYHVLTDDLSESEAIPVAAMMTGDGNDGFDSAGGMTDDGATDSPDGTDGQTSMDSAAGKTDGQENTGLATSGTRDTDGVPGATDNGTISNSVISIAQKAGTTSSNADGKTSENGQTNSSAMQTEKYQTPQTQFSDRANVIFKLVTQISTEDILIIEEMAKDGFTNAEKEAVRGIMSGYFTQTEIECVLDLYRQVRGV